MLPRFSQPRGKWNWSDGQFSISWERFFPCLPETKPEELILQLKILCFSMEVMICLHALILTIFVLKYRAWKLRKTIQEADSDSNSMLSQSCSRPLIKGFP